MKTNTSRKGNWGKVGAPPKAVAFPRGKFTIKKLVTLNKGVCELTLRKRIDAGVEAGTITQLKETVRQDGVGRPNFLFTVNGSVADLNKAGRPTAKARPAAKTAKAVRKPRKAKVVTPVATVVPTPIPVATPVPTSPTPEPVAVTVVDDVKEGSEVPAAFTGVTGEA